MGHGRTAELRLETTMTVPAESAVASLGPGVRPQRLLLPLAPTLGLLMAPLLLLPLLELALLPLPLLMLAAVFCPLRTLAEVAAAADDDDEDADDAVAPLNSTSICLCRLEGAGFVHDM